MSNNEDNTTSMIVLAVIAGVMFLGMLGAHIDNNRLQEDNQILQQEVLMYKQATLKLMRTLREGCYD